MDSVREKITIELARSKIRTEEIYSIIKDIADHIEAPKAVPVPAPAPEPTPEPADKPSAKPAAKKIVSPPKKAPAKKAPAKKA